MANQRPFPQESRGAEADGRRVLLWPQSETLGWRIMSQDCSCPSRCQAPQPLPVPAPWELSGLHPTGYHPQFSGPLSWFQAGVTSCCLSVVLSSPGPLPSPASSSSCSQAFAPSFPCGHVVSSSFTVSSSSAKSMCAFLVTGAQSRALHSQEPY